jgi:hypothetical protein
VRAIPDNPTTIDTAGFESDVNRLAHVLAAGANDPPLAVALLGVWGSGKSSFMTQLEARIRELAASGDPAFDTTIGHVRFNAWNYSDTTALLGMVHQIFRALGEQFPDGPEDTGGDTGGLAARHARSAADTAARIRHIDRWIQAIADADAPRRFLVLPPPRLARTSKWPKSRSPSSPTTASTTRCSRSAPCMSASRPRRSPRRIR